MPLTFAHPAAVLPISGLLGRFGVLSALIIGSMAPDFVYFIPIGIHGSDSHSIGGLLWFCVPSGLLVFFVFHRWLKCPLVSLFPKSIQRRIVVGATSPVAKSYFPITISVLVGSITHVAWDSLTHAKSPWNSLRPLLDHELFSVGAYQVFVFRLLQHASTLLGLVLIAWWVRCWHVGAVAKQSTTFASPSNSRIATAVAVTSLVAVSVGGVFGLSAIGPREGMLALQHFLVKAIVTAVPVYIFAFLGYCIWWHRLRGSPKSYG